MQSNFAMNATICFLCKNSAGSPEIGDHVDMSCVPENIYQ